MKGVNYIFLLASMLVYSQHENGISIVQASAEFTKEANLNIKKLDDTNTFNYDIGKDSSFFEDYNVIYLPTIILFNNGKEIKRWEADITLKLKCKLEDLQDEINKLIEDKF
tara:strand:- start:980 stop:1312 length:333 start_codon:yes stop_codon:yes gene_type:complete